MLRRSLLVLLIFFALAAALPGAQLPRKAPEFPIKLTSGQQLLLSSFRGKVVALMFVSTDCPHCQNTARFMESMQKQFGPKGLQTLAVAFNPMAIMLVQEFVNRTGTTYPVGFSDRDPVYAFLDRSVNLRTYVPIFVFIDREGMIRSQHLGDDPLFGPDDATRDSNIRKMIEKLLREPAAGAKKAAAPVKK